jgi:hypothetical protein
MKKIVMWVLSILYILMGFLSIATSVIASIAFLIGGAYLSPLVRSKYLSEYEENFLLKRNGTILIASVLFIIGFVKISGSQESDAKDRVVSSYQKSPVEFVDKLKKNIDEKKFYLAISDLDKVLEKIPSDEKLKSIRHDALILELKADAAEDKIYQFNERDIDEYKKVMGNSAKIEEIQQLYEDLASEKIKKLLAKEEAIEAKVAIDNLQKMFPNSKKITELKDQKDDLDKKIKIREEALARAKEAEARAKEAEEAARQKAFSSASSANGLSRVVAKVGSLIYLANQKTFAIERPTILHIDGQMYPKGSGSPDYIQVGYRCRFLGSEFNVTEVFCER